MNQLEKFISKVNLKHDNKYTYNKSIYIDNYTKIIITCKIHGDFSQTPNTHLRGYGCVKCGQIKAKLLTSKTTNCFITEANKKHNNIYNYSKTNYTKAKSKVIITCKTHGDFLQTPNSHLLGIGCSKCGKIKCRISQTKKLDDFINEANIIHNNKYNYDKSVYINYITKMIITCPKHGDFLQIPNGHLHASNGCPTCSSSKGENIIENYLLNNNIQFIKEKTFIDCLSENNKKLRFDFYLKDLNCIIEYDGIQHFQSVPRFGGIKAFKICKMRDEIKNIYCNKNKINLIRISYKNKENILNILNILNNYFIK